MDSSLIIEPLIDLPIAHAWRGHYSTIFLELGKLQTGRTRRDGSTGNATGQFTIHLEPNWRLEGKRSIQCGSDDTTRAIDNAILRLVGNKIGAVSVVGRLPELEITTSDFRLCTFSARKGQPNWTINSWSPALAMYCRLGKIALDGPRT